MGLLESWSNLAQTLSSKNEETEFKGGEGEMKGAIRIMICGVYCGHRGRHAGEDRKGRAKQLTGQIVQLY